MTYLIAEAGVNHNGDLQLAHQLIDVAQQTGAQAVKFQAFNAQQLVAKGTAKADYQIANGASGDDQQQMLEQLALPMSAFAELQQHCATVGIDFLASPFDHASAKFLIDELNLKVIKLGSGELTNGPLLWDLARADVQLILSTGMATLDEIRASLGLLSHARAGHWPTPQTQEFGPAYKPELLSDWITLLHCTTAYPCPIDAVNLRAMDTLKEQFGLPVGYSDHTQGITVALTAAARGAGVIEKHFTLDRNMVGPDHAASLEPNELRALAEGLEQIEIALGSADKRPSENERAIAAVARKSLVSCGPIAPGDTFNPSNITAKRPGTGVSPMRYWSMLGRQAQVFIDDDSLIPEEPES